jgi:Bacteriodetes cell division protein (FtsL-like)
MKNNDNKSSIPEKGEANGAAVTTSHGRWQLSRLGYRWVVRNVGFLLFLATLAVVYIYNGHYADNISRELNRTNKELKELQYEYKTLKSEVMFRSKESELAKAVAPFGLGELTQPPFVLLDSTQK